jgi:hypothetical protein
MKKPVQSRIPSQLSKSLDTKLKHYALAASAAGAGLLAASPAEARVIYTAANEAIPYNEAPVAIDLNHDGINDFTLSALETGGRFYQTFVRVTPSGPANRVWGMMEKSGANSASILAAADLPRGVQVGPKGRFANSGAELLAERYISEGTTRSTQGTFGLWANHGQGAVNRFLAFKFIINNQTHYGWARLNVVMDGYPRATLTGYAFETIPNKPIITGLTAGTDVSTTEPEPATLGHLAAGAAVLQAWRGGGTPEH